MIGYGAATPLGKTFGETWARAVRGEAGFGPITRCNVKTQCSIVGEIPGWEPLELGFTNKREVHFWNAAFVLLTMAVCKEALENSGLVMDGYTGPRTACLIGSALNGTDAFRTAMQNYLERGPLKVSPYLLPNLCANLPSGKAGILLGFTGPIFSPQGACASGNHAIGIGARMIRDGDCDFVLAGGVETPVIPEIVHGFENMNATVKITPRDRAFHNPSLASRPFSADRKGFVLSEGAGVLVLAAEEMLGAYGLKPRAEVLGIGWTSDAYHFTNPNPDAIIRAITAAIEDAALSAPDIDYVNAHGPSTQRGDKVELECLKKIFGREMKRIPVSSNKSQVGHSLGAAAGIENALTIQGMQEGLILPTINHVPDPALEGFDLVPDAARRQHYEIALSNAFGFGGTNCCVIFKGV